MLLYTIWYTYSHNAMPGRCAISRQIVISWVAVSVAGTSTRSFVTVITAGHLHDWDASRMRRLTISPARSASHLVSRNSLRNKWAERKYFLTFSSCVVTRIWNKTFYGIKNIMKGINIFVILLLRNKYIRAKNFVRVYSSKKKVIE